MRGERLGIGVRGIVAIPRTGSRSIATRPARGLVAALIPTQLPVLDQSPWCCHSR
jgi:hypothetical protein